MKHPEITSPSLDTYTTCENGSMSTDIYNKPTDKHQYLSPQSCHPKHCTIIIPYSQALRIKRICSSEQTTKKKRLGELRCHLKKRGYNNASINHCFKKASGIDRKDLIQYKEQKTNNRVPFVITYHPELSNLSIIVRDRWTTIQKHQELCKIFKDPPVLAFRKPKSSKDILVRADISPRSACNGLCQKRDSRRCMTYKNIQCKHTGEE
jgi:peptide-methionine (R)-S-oxide reductase